MTFTKILSESYVAIRQFTAAALGWLIGYPLTKLLKRNPDLTIVLGRRGPVFADNSKYFFVYANELLQDNERVVFFASHPSIFDKITETGAEVVMHPSWQSLELLLRCGKIVTDMADWVEYGAYPLTQGAKRIQLWHGAPLKYIELHLYQKRLDALPSWLGGVLRIQKAVICRYPVYDVVAVTSQGFITDVFQHCFKAKHFTASGYPRNDILFGWPKEGSVANQLAWVNVDQLAMGRVDEEKSKGQTICLYVPTFRHDMANPFDTVIDLAKLSEFAVGQKMLIVIKLHPCMHGQCEFSKYPNLLEYAPMGDVYPLMALCDLLITDYSSIFFDFLLLDRPILFFAYDLENYLSNDRNIYFDYDEMTPGAKCQNYNELELQIEAIIRNGGKDAYSEMRKSVREYTYDYSDNQAHKRLIGKS